MFDLAWLVYSHSDFQMNHSEAATVLLRPHRESDKQAFAAVARNEEFYRLLGAAAPTELSRAQEAELWFQKKTDPTHSWAVEVDLKCVGSVFLHSIEPDNRRARFAIELFDPAYWGRGIGTSATRQVVRFAFEILRLHRLDLRVLTVNTRAIRCYERCGFVKEGVQRDTLFNDGEWFSDLWMSMLESEYVPSGPTR